MISRIYQEKDISGLTLDEVESLMQSDDVQYSGDYGFKVQDNVKLIVSLN